jgi:hypothetical protein
VFTVVIAASEKCLAVLNLYHSVVLQTEKYSYIRFLRVHLLFVVGGLFLAAPAVFYPLGTSSITLTELKRLQEQTLGSLAHPKVNFDEGYFVD